MSKSLLEAFAQFGATPRNRLRSRSAIASDGTLVLSCATARFQRPGPGVLRYEDTLSRDPTDGQVTVLLGEHLTLARDGKLPVRMIVIAESGTGRTRRNIYGRPDLVGELTEFDGDHFIVDFKRAMADPEPPDGHRRRRS